MEPVLKVASYIAKRYQNEFGERISEMKLHKLLYFTQRESIIQFGIPMFNETFLAWKYGPVIPSIRIAYANNLLIEVPSKVWQEKYTETMNFIFTQYASKDAWSLSFLTHNELSWKRARHGLSPDQNGNKELALDDIKADALQMKWRRYVIDTYNSKNK